MEKSGIVISRRVWTEGEPSLTVEESADAPGYVRLVADCEKAIEYWGSVDITLPKDMALALAKALTDCASELP